MPEAPVPVPVPVAYACEIGEILARIHALDVEWTSRTTEEATSRDWPLSRPANGRAPSGGKLPPPGPSWFVSMIGGWLGFTRWDILRCLTGVEASTGPDLALLHESVRNGVRGLPDMFGRLPELEKLLV